ncbi:MAG: hypothetical protein Unbinned5858contig1001_42 [Prokaryotic dsDNA virus sp.]|nr:MAG: hypothetical protein Unbinned5858contig1001_42 [Prokaryotic dsDNA virus sp.]|tara:strand:- start:1598 stop:1954 length:357 start_codon:yes stop_codon:yes gene_type:complete
MNVGKLNKRIQIVRNTLFGTGAVDDRPNSYGEYSITGTTTTATIWAKVSFKNSAIKDQFGEPVNKVLASFIVRKKSLNNNYDLGDFIIYDSQKFKMNKVYEYDINDYIIIEATKLDNE